MRVDPSLQCPAPSQAYSPTTASPSHVPGLHIVLAGYLRQAPLPSQVPSSPHVDAAVFAQVVESRGASPDERITQVPTLPVALHVLQPSVQAALQHTPSAQKPLAHSALQPQASLFAFVPATHGLTSAASPPSPGRTSVLGWTSPAGASPPSGLLELDFLQLIAAMPASKPNAISARAPARPTTLDSDFMVSLRRAPFPR